MSTNDLSASSTELITCYHAISYEHAGPALMAFKRITEATGCLLKPVGNHDSASRPYGVLQIIGKQNQDILEARRMIDNICINENKRKWRKFMYQKAHETTLSEPHKEFFFFANSKQRERALQCLEEVKKQTDVTVMKVAVHYAPGPNNQKVELDAPIYIGGDPLAVEKARRLLEQHIANGTQEEKKDNEKNEESRHSSKAPTSQKRSSNRKGPSTIDINKPNLKPSKGHDVKNGSSGRVEPANLSNQKQPHGHKHLISDPSQDRPKTSASAKAERTEVKNTPRAQSENNSRGIQGQELVASEELITCYHAISYEHAGPVVLAFKSIAEATGCSLMPVGNQNRASHPYGVLQISGKQTQDIWKARRLIDYVCISENKRQWHEFMRQKAIKPTFPEPHKEFFFFADGIRREKALECMEDVKRQTDVTALEVVVHFAPASGTKKLALDDPIYIGGRLLAVEKARRLLEQYIATAIQKEQKVNEENKENCQGIETSIPQNKSSDRKPLSNVGLEKLNLNSSSVEDGTTSASSSTTKADSDTAATRHQGKPQNRQSLSDIDVDKMSPKENSDAENGQDVAKQFNKKTADLTKRHEQAKMQGGDMETASRNTTAGDIDMAPPSFGIRQDLSFLDLDFPSAKTEPFKMLIQQYSLKTGSPRDPGNKKWNIEFITGFMRENSHTIFEQELDNLFGKWLQMTLVDNRELWKDILEVHKEFKRLCRDWTTANPNAPRCRKLKK